MPNYTPKPPATPKRKSVKRQLEKDGVEYSMSARNLSIKPVKRESFKKAKTEEHVAKVVKTSADRVLEIEETIEIIRDLDIAVWLKDKKQSLREKFSTIVSICSNTTDPYVEYINRNLRLTYQIAILYNKLISNEATTEDTRNLKSLIDRLNKSVRNHKTDVDFGNLKKLTPVFVKMLLIELLIIAKDNQIPDYNQTFKPPRKG